MFLTTHLFSPPSLAPSIVIYLITHLVPRPRPLPQSSLPITNSCPLAHPSRSLARSDARPAVDTAAQARRRRVAWCYVARVRKLPMLSISFFSKKIIDSTLVQLIFVVCCVSTLVVTDISSNSSNVSKPAIALCVCVCGCVLRFFA